VTDPTEYFLYLYFRSNVCIKNRILNNIFLTSLGDLRQSEVHMQFFISLAVSSHQVAHDLSRCFCFWLQDNLMNQVFLSFLFVL